MVARRQRERGAAAVEAALVLCFIVLPLIFAVIAYAYMFSFRQALSQAADEGARAAVGAPTSGTCSASTAPASFTSAACPAQYAAVQAVQSALGQYNMSCVSSTAAVTDTSHLACSVPPPGSCNTTHTCITVTLSYPYRDHSLLPTVPGLGFTLPSTLTFTSVVEVS